LIVKKIPQVSQPVIIALLIHIWLIVCHVTLKSMLALSKSK